MHKSTRRALISLLKIYGASWIAVGGVDLALLFVSERRANHGTLALIAFSIAFFVLIGVKNWGQRRSVNG